MLVERTSILSGKTHQMEIDISERELARLEPHGLLIGNAVKWCVPGMLIQHAFPDLSADEREFLMTGITPEEWNETFEEWNETFANKYAE